MRVLLSVPWTSPWLGAQGLTDSLGVSTLARANEWEPSRLACVKNLLVNARHLFGRPSTPKRWWWSASRGETHVRVTLPSPELRDRVGAAARQEARSVLDPAVVLNQMLKCVREHAR